LSVICWLLVSRDRGAWLRQTNPVPTLSGGAVIAMRRGSFPKPLWCQTLFLILRAQVPTEGCRCMGRGSRGCLFRELPYAASKQASRVSEPGGRLYSPWQEKSSSLPRAFRCWRDWLIGISVSFHLNLLKEQEAEANSSFLSYLYWHRFQVLSKLERECVKIAPIRPPASCHNPSITRPARVNLLQG